MENDDRPIGRILSRREVLKLLGLASAAALLAGCSPDPVKTRQPATSAIITPYSTIPSQTTAASSTAAAPSATAALSTATAPSLTSLPACIVRPELTEGPYYIDVDLIRSDIRSDPSTGVVKEGAPLTLTFNVSQVGPEGCSPLPGADVEIWHCDASGVYSGVSDPGFNTQGQKFLRGLQVTDTNGQATFITIYPGYYPGRAVHIHFKIHNNKELQPSEFTSQLFFDDTLSDKVLSRAPYVSRGQRTSNSTDRIFNEQLLLNVAEAADGYSAAFDIGLQLG